MPWGFPNLSFWGLEFFLFVLSKAECTALYFQYWVCPTFLLLRAPCPPLHAFEGCRSPTFVLLMARSYLLCYFEIWKFPSFILLRAEVLSLFLPNSWVFFPSNLPKAGAPLCSLESWNSLQLYYTEDWVPLLCFFESLWFFHWLSHGLGVPHFIHLRGRFFPSPL